MLHGAGCRVVALDRIARIIAAIVQAPITIVTIRGKQGFSAVGGHGICVHEVDESWCLQAASERGASMTFIRNVRRHPKLAKHPLLAAAPFVKSLVYIPVPHNADFGEASITIVDPVKSWPFTAEIASNLLELAFTTGDIITLLQSDWRSSIDARDAVSAQLPSGFAESPVENSTVSNFLVNTLVKRTSIKTRGGVSYVTLRTWSRTIKKHQIAALKTCKAPPNQGLINAIASEMADHVSNLYGTPHINCVVAVPCGHSKPGQCLSEALAKRLANLLDVPFEPLLQAPARKGSSHPAKNAALDGVELTDHTIANSILLVDDVATSGRHIELAVKALRERSKHVSAIAWIGS